tara:strand:+ start:385 stop:564 length:180 start_codon:yes stop_codon:yes gene_type:complete
MAAMKRELENLIQKQLKEKAENRAIIEHAYYNHEISEEHYIAEINALDLGEKTIKELKL